MVLSCQVLKEAGEMEKIGSPVSVDEAVSTTSTVVAPQAQATNPYAQQQQKPQQVQQPPPSQYVRNSI
jgi:hypothetical protein